jgi:hypothetical protein
MQSIKSRIFRLIFKISLKIFTELRTFGYMLKQYYIMNS